MKVKDKTLGEEFYVGPSNLTSDVCNDSIISMLLYIKERFGISNAAYHVLSQVIPNLPGTSQLKKKITSLNEKWEVNSAPNGIIGVQQSLETLLKQKIEHMLMEDPAAEIRTTRSIKVKLTGDGTNIGCSLM